MNLADERLKELDAPSLTANQRIVLRCRLASEFIHTGRYDAAREALGQLWRGIGQRPNTEGMEQSLTAEVLLQVGALSGWIGASQQIAGAQEKAKDLISESASLFEQIGETDRAASARSDLALCYWRTGAYDEARVLLESAFKSITETVGRLKAILRLTTVELSASRYHDALSLLERRAHLFGEEVSHALRGSFHSHLAVTLKQLGTLEDRPDYLDRAIIEYTAAIHHFEQAQHDRYRANNENNLANLLRKMGHYQQAHEHLDRARRTLVRLNDVGILAQVDETRARVFIAERKYREANRIIAGAIQTLEKGGQSALLADALTVQGVAWARLGVHESSISILRRAMNIARDCGALVNAGLAALTLIEEHGASRLSPMELYSVYRRADELLKKTQDTEAIARLRACARVVLRRLSGVNIHDKDFNLYGVVYDFEAKFIEQALEESDGSVTRAAKLLGMRHQSLVYLLKTRHKKLLKSRTPPRRRGRTVFKKE
ncbi:MAG TPA: helix-turn-helix domain-containing protein [Pyrinomonadaceae bacterium]|nr:helix-turn-helix domain-containing protein [Pyrinomonadaceae bacterium]